MPDSMNLQSDFRQFRAQQLTRRAFLGRAAQGVGALALASLIDPSLARAAAAADKWRGVINPLHFPAKAKRVIWLTMAGGPSMGTWATCGLGSDGDVLPGSVVLVSLGIGRSPQPIATRQWSSGFLPSRFQGVQLRGKGDPVLYLPNPRGVSREQQGDVVA